MRKLAKGKSEKHSPFFDEWLTLMERAFEMLTEPAFKRLEERIIAEIKFHKRGAEGRNAE